MRYFIFSVLPLFICLFTVNVFAQTPEKDVLKERVEILEKELREIKQLLKKQIEKDIGKEEEITALKRKMEEKELREAEPVPEEKPKPMFEEEDEKEFYLTKKSAELPEKGLAPSFGGIYTKPFLRRFGRNTYVGGYMDFEFRAPEDEDSPHGFTQKRFIPFIYSDISDRVKLATEIEFEFGGVGGGRSGEVILEFGTIDFLITDWLNWRGGFLLTPLGKFNLVHDSPLQDLTDRPLVDQLIIPTTLTDLGAGFFGTLYPTELSKLDYELYVTNGIFSGLNDAGSITFEEGFGLMGSKGAAGYFDDNFNKNPGVVGRVNYSPFLGLDVGVSSYTQRYDENNENQLTISALDFTYQRGAFEFLGEGAYAFIETDDFSEESGITDDMWGYYLEARYHFMPSFLTDLSPQFFSQNSTFTGVLRWGQVQTAGRDDDFERVHWLRSRTTFGLNYRYTEDTVFKLDYQLNTESKDMPDKANNAALFSVATYF